MPVWCGRRGYTLTSEDFKNRYWVDEDGKKHSLSQQEVECYHPGDVIGGTGGWMNGEWVSTPEDIDEQMRKYGVGF